MERALTAIAVVSAIFAGLPVAQIPPAESSPFPPVVFTQLPTDAGGQTRSTLLEMTLSSDFGERGRLVLLQPDGKTRVLSRGFHSACDPDVSFDGRRILFSGKRSAKDRWSIYEMAADGSAVRQVVSVAGNCRSPIYQSTLYTLNSREPWYQITFVSDSAGELNEAVPTPSTSLFSCRLDGSELRRLTFNPSSDSDPYLMEDGRILFSSWQRSTLDRGPQGRVGLFGINLDGTDLALFAADEGQRIKRMACVTRGGLVLFVGSEQPRWDGAGQLGFVRLSRNRHSYEPIPAEPGFVFHSPSPLPDGAVLVSRRPIDGKGSHGVYRLNPVDGSIEPVVDDPGVHEIQAKALVARAEPDGRSSVVSPDDPTGALYCLNIGVSDLADQISPAVAPRVRVLEGVPLNRGNPVNVLARGHFPEFRSLHSALGLPSLIQRRFLGEFDIEQDGSFYIKVPAGVPIQLQLVDSHGMAIRSCSWIWVMNHEPRGCIGCHEDGELTPENRMVEAVKKPAIDLVIPEKVRRTVDFRRDVMPVISSRCAVGGCHEGGSSSLPLDGEAQTAGVSRGNPFNRAYTSLMSRLEDTGDGAGVAGRYVVPGKARSSPLIWLLSGRDTSRPWDGQRGEVEIDPALHPAHRTLTEEEMRALIEWIDLGALWDGIPGPDDFSAPGTGLRDRKEGQR